MRRDRAILKFPIKGGRLFLYNHNPLVRAGYRGITGLKTGYTDRAGRSIVATARRHDRELGVVLLHSYDAATQARRAPRPRLQVLGHKTRRGSLTPPTLLQKRGGAIVIYGPIRLMRRVLPVPAAGVRFYPMLELGAAADTAGVSANLSPAGQR